MSRNCMAGAVALIVALTGGYPVVRSFAQPLVQNAQSRQMSRYLHEESAHGLWMPRPSVSPLGVEIRCEPVVLGAFRSVQVNVDAFGCNIAGDAANEPSIAIDPTDPRRMAIGWRQFDTVESSFRQAGVAYSHDGGHSWVFPGALAPGVFHTDPVLESDTNGNFFFLAIRCIISGCGEVFKSVDGGVTWGDPVPAYVGDKPWMVVDRTGGPGNGNIYLGASDFIRSSDEGTSFQRYYSNQYSLASRTMAVGPSGEVFFGIYEVTFDAWDPTTYPTFVELPGLFLGYFVALEPGSPNPGGLLGQFWVACDLSTGPLRGSLYTLGSVRLSLDAAVTQVMFARSLDGGYSWSIPIQINDDPESTEAWHWLGTMSVAPNGRIDVFWNDTRNTGQANLSELFYAFSEDGGETWSPNTPVSPVFDSYVGQPFGSFKLGDYYHSRSDNLGANIAYAATFNGEQDIYFLRIGPYDCNGNEIPDENDLADGASLDCNANDVPDECEYRGDFNGDRLTGLDDHSAYITCRTDPGAPIGALCCGLFDSEPDGDADLADFAFVQRAFAIHEP